MTISNKEIHFKTADTIQGYSFIKSDSKLSFKYASM